MGNDAGAGQPATNPLGYRPALDGVRGIAILVVVSLHAPTSEVDESRVFAIWMPIR